MSLQIIDYMIPDNAQFRKSGDKAIKFSQKMIREYEQRRFSDEEYFEKKKKLAEYLEVLKKSQLELMGATSKEINDQVICLDEAKKEGLIDGFVHKEKTKDLFSEKEEIIQEMGLIEIASNEEYLAYLGNQFDAIRLGIRYGIQKRREKLKIPQKRSLMRVPTEKEEESLSLKKTRFKNLEHMDWAKAIGIFLISIAIFAGAYYEDIRIMIIFLFVLITVMVVWISSLHFTTNILEFEKSKPYTAFQCVMMQSILNLPVLFAAYLLGWLTYLFPFLNFFISIYAISITYRINALKSLIVTVNSLFFTYIIFFILMTFIILPLVGFSLLSLLI